MKINTSFVKEGNLFIRPFSSKVNEDFIRNFLDKKLNVNTVLNGNKKLTNKNFIFGYEQDYLAYRFEVLRLGINKNEYYNQRYTNQLNKIIKNLQLENFLKAQEDAYLDHINGINLAKTRTLKNLIVDFDLNQKPKESALFFFENINLYQIDPETRTKKLIIQNANCYLTSQRILISDSFLYYDIPFTKTKGFKLNHSGVFGSTENTNFEIHYEDKYLLYICCRIIIYDYLNIKNNGMGRKINNGN